MRVTKESPDITVLFILPLGTYLRNGRLVCPLLPSSGAMLPPERVADLADADTVAVVATKPPLWLPLEEDPAPDDDARWIPLSPLELPDLKWKEIEFNERRSA